MPQTLIMQQPLLPLDTIEYREWNGPSPSLFTTYEFTAPFVRTAVSADANMKNTERSGNSGAAPAGVRFICGACIELLIPLAASGKPSPPLLILGAGSKCRQIPLACGCRYFGIRFAPGIFYWSEPILFSELYDTFLSLDDPEDYSPILPANLARFESLEKRTAYFFENVLPCLKKQHVPPAVAHMLSRITETNGSLQVGQLAKELSYSERHVNRLFLTALGFGPKLFCKQIRFQSTLAEMKKMPDRNIASFLKQAGYSDQAHFQREFKEFTGLTPKQYIRLIYG